MPAIAAGPVRQPRVVAGALLEVIRKALPRALAMTKSRQSRYCSKYRHRSSRQFLKRALAWLSAARATAISACSPEASALEKAGGGAPWRVPAGIQAGPRKLRGSHGPPNAAPPVRSIVVCPSEKAVRCRRKASSASWSSGNSASSSWAGEVLPTRRAGATAAAQWPPLPTRPRPLPSSPCTEARLANSSQTSAKCRRAAATGLSTQAPPPPPPLTDATDAADARAAAVASAASARAVLQDRGPGRKRPGPREAALNSSILQRAIVTFRTCSKEASRARRSSTRAASSSTMSPRNNGGGGRSTPTSANNDHCECRCAAAKPAAPPSPPSPAGCGTASGR
mmetsp:Transcript_105477/g.339716  ORF Transcript_105477/g.339716 Transcript_105477/m.339716 type:complete len:339 (+) Transcript_105477:722-1738(+)